MAQIWMLRDYYKPSSLSLELYAEHSMRNSELVARFSEDLQGILKRTEDATSKVTCILQRYHGSNPASNESTSAGYIELKIEVSAAATSLGATGSNLAEIIPMAKESVEQMKVAPKMVAKVSNAGTAINDQLQSTEDALSVWSPLLEKVELFSNLVDHLAEIHPYAKMAWSVLSVAHKTILAQKTHDEGITRLVETVSDAFAFIQEAEALEKIQMLKDTTLKLAQQTTECAYFIREYAKDRSFWTRTLKNIASQVDDQIQEYEAKFKEIKEAFTLRTSLHTSITVTRVMNRVESTAVEVILDDMAYAQGARYDVEKGCLPGTRVAILDDLISWVNGTLPDPAMNERNILLLSGVAGSGKSAIAHTLAKHFDQIGRLGSSYCFNRSKQAQLGPGNFFSTISRNLADLDPQWKDALWKVVEGNRALRTTYAVQEQFERFLVQPAADLTGAGPIVFIIDALDESGDVSARKMLLSVLSRRISELPLRFRFILTARPEQDILKSFFDNPLVLCRQMDDIEHVSTIHDIRMFIEHELEEVSELEEEWPKREWLNTLVDKSEGLFQWAFTACLFIKGDDEGGLDPVEQMQILISSPVAIYQTKLDRLDQLYMDILKHVFPTENKERMARFQSVLGEILAALEPLPISALLALRVVKETRDIVTLLVHPLGALLSGVSSRDIPVRPLHTSFRDFLTDPSRSGSFWVDTKQAQRMLFDGCIQTMKSLLRFNICKLPTSYLPTQKIPDLGHRIHQNIPIHLSYSCRHWLEHLVSLDFQSTIAEILVPVLERFTLFWFEVLAIVNQMEVAAVGIGLLLEWCEEGSRLYDLAAEIDSFQFMFGEVIATSAPHLYLSAVPFTPDNASPFTCPSKRLSHLFQSQLSETVKISQGRLTSWPTLRRRLHHSQATHITFSSDGSRLLSVAKDGSLYIWNLLSSNAEMISLAVPEQIGSDPDIYLSPPTISPDCRSVAAAASANLSQDNLPCQGLAWVCDAETGELLSLHRAIPIDKHQRTSCRLTFSPDGAFLVGGFLDGNIYIWAIGSETSLPTVAFHQPTEDLCDIAISLNSQKLATCDEEIIFIWDIHDGKLLHRLDVFHRPSIFTLKFACNGTGLLVGVSSRVSIIHPETGELIATCGPLPDHEGVIYAISDDNKGALVASGYSDGVVCVWNLASRSVVSFFETQDRHIARLTFSPDGKRLAASSNDGMISLWDVGDPTAVHTAERRERHYDSITLSPNGRVLAATVGIALKIWLIDNGSELVVETYLTQSEEVDALAFTPSGSHLLSGSLDGTISLWEAGEIQPEEFGREEFGPVMILSNVWKSRSGFRFAAAYRDRTVRIWDLESRTVTAWWQSSLEPSGNSKPRITSVVSVSNGHYVVLGRANGAITIINAETGQVIRELLESGRPVKCLAWTQSIIGDHAKKAKGDGFLAVGLADGSISVWDITNFRRHAGPFILNDGTEEYLKPVRRIAFSPSGSILAAAFMNGTVCLSNPANGEHLSGPLVGQDSVVSLAFSSTGSRLICAGKDASIRIWDVPKTLDLYRQPSSETTAQRGSVGDGSDSKHWFKDNSSPDDSGWLKGPSGELLLWIPPSQREGLLRPSNIVTDGRLTKLDFSHFVAGEYWAECWRDSEA